jgi:hypothetical protein
MNSDERKELERRLGTMTSKGKIEAWPEVTFNGLKYTRSNIDRIPVPGLPGRFVVIDAPTKIKWELFDPLRPKEARKGSEPDAGTNNTSVPRS